MSSAGGHGETSDFERFAFTFIQMEYTFMQNDFRVRIQIYRICEQLKVFLKGLTATVQFSVSSRIEAYWLPL